MRSRVRVVASRDASSSHAQPPLMNLAGNPVGGQCPRDRCGGGPPMSLLFRVLALSVVVLVCLRESPQDAVSQVPGPADQAFVHNGFVRVIDGDTVEIWKDDRRWGIGLIGIEAPQANTACGMSATARMWELTAQGAKFHAEADYPNEKYRLMYKADTLEDVSIEAALVAEGLAK